ncbi:hypothetical protein FNU76_10115 [Chitinimonas arctica]|uniref:Uncharacterized protein n=1 Tax=Chitinimonas arctica TaxID=2594795 RepID=A0A516SEU6_9NEIS|nr:hypothetical protein [Chitinimonas arctica]QDQ26689.1 hypothetical protein FNU76_10115 [Chitinimonas arctica]
MEINEQGISDSDRILHRYRAHSWQGKNLYVLSLKDKTVQPICFDSNTTLPRNGLIVDYECNLRGGAAVFFAYRKDGRLFFGLNEKTFDASDSSISCSHKKGLFFSELTITEKNAKKISLLYITPWWRIFLDDGSFPEDRFPLQEMAVVLSDPEKRKTIFNGMAD